jgi:excisionase family DNA binding protein
MTPQELAEYLQINPDTLRQWARRNKGPAYIMVEGARRYSPDAVREYLEHRTVSRG